MVKQAKDFGLLDFDSKNTTFEVNPAEQMPESAEEAIVLDIIGDDSATLAAGASQKYNKTGSDKIKFLKAYQKLHKAFSLQRKVPLDEKAVFYELMSTMISAGVPLISAVRVYADQASNRYFKKITEAISYQLEKGQSLSEAMAEYKRIFTEAEVGIVESAEATGRLNEALMRLARQAEDALALRGKIRSAMIYPAIVVIFVIGAIYSMLTFVIPQISDLFVQSGLELPFLTRFLISASDFVVNNGFLLLIGLVLAFIIIGVFSRTRSGKYIFHTLYLRIPVLKDFQRAIYQARFARSISNLLNSGVSIVQACEITARSMNNVIYQKKVRLIGKDVSRGIQMAESMQDSPYFSNLLVSMFAVGERTAQLDDLAAKTADYFEAKVSNMASNFSKIIQPFIIAIVGGMVGVVVLSIMLPMTELLGGIEGL